MLELRDRLAQIDGAAAAGAEAAAAPAGRLRDDLVSALVNLGYHRPQAEKSVETALASEPDLPFDQALRRVLKDLIRA